MDVQTDSHTPCTEPTRDVIKGFDDNMACFIKATANQEATFVLREQDASAPAVVKFWIKAQHRIMEGLKAGLTLDQAVQALESYYFLDEYQSPLTPKQAKALAIAEGMAGYEHRRLAD